MRVEGTGALTPGRPRTVVVTGAAGGLGRALCAELRGRGWQVVATDVRGTEHCLDVRDAAACRALAEAVRPDGWINNAGVLGPGSAIDQPDAVVEQVLAVNLAGAIHGSRAAAAVMRAQGRGQIVNVGSLASWFAPTGQAVYAASKHGLRAFTIALAAELHGTGVGVSLLCPDGIATPMLQGRETDPHAAMSFTARHLLDAAAVARVGADLLESGGLVRSVPRLKGWGSRLVGFWPWVNVRFTRILARIGRRRQRRLERQA